MLKVLHTGDWHIGSFPGPEVNGQNARFQDICRCLDFQAMYAEEHRPDLIVVSGDIFHQARVWSDRGLRESRTAIDHIRRLSNVATTVVLRGTPNHDSEEQFEMLTTAFYGDDSVSVVTEPEVLHIHTYHGQRVDVACVPGFDRGVHRAAHPGLSREEETQVFTDELAKVVLGLKAQCEPGVTSILSTHFTVPGCNMESGQTALFAQFEPVIYPDTLKAADFDLVALGHIHRPQQLPEAGRAVFYCGSITGLNFNDENQPRGFYIHDIDDDGEAWSEYVETPYREFETIRLKEDDIRAMLSAERVTTTKAGVLNGCETHDGFIRFFAQRIPEADIQATVTLFGKGGGSGETGSVSIGQGLKRDASGAIAVRIGEGLDFDSANALTVRKETVMTSEDLLDEEETQQEIVDMLK